VLVIAFAFSVSDLLFFCCWGFFVMMPKRIP
jgi:hypothetical protein